MTRPTDAAVRDRALDPRRSFIVQAPAGSGKTELLVQRHLALLATVSRPEEILSITFTRKAAFEMRHRLLKALESAQAPPPAEDHSYRTWHLATEVLDKDRALGWQLLDNPARLTIQTIDSFNAWLARRTPWISGLGGMPEVSDDPESLYREAVRRTLDRISSGSAGGNSGTTLLRHLDNRMERLADMLIALLWRRDQWLRHLGGTWEGEGTGRSMLEKGMAAFVSDLLKDGRDLLPVHLWPAIAAAGRYAAGNSDPSQPMAALAILEGIPGTEPKDLPIWHGLAALFLTKSGDLRRTVNKNSGFPSGADKTPKESMQGLLGDPAVDAWAAALKRIQNLPAPVYPDDQWQVLQSLVQLLKLAVAELWLVFKERGQADFAEMAMRALQGLGEPGGASDLLLQLDAGMTHILVDEFQDTSYLQLALLTRLVDGWEDGDGRTLFLVGDPMQSIYRFREAEVGLFLRAQQSGIGQIVLENLRLTANFRSVPGIVKWVNNSFSSAFPEFVEVASGAVTYAPAESFRPDEAGSGVTVHSNIGRNDGEEARLVVELCRKSLEEGGGSVAILVRSRTHLSKILPALRAANLRYLAQDIDLLNDRQVALDLVSLTRALLHPADRQSWLSVLRAPWCGLSLDDLHALCGNAPDDLMRELISDPNVLARLSVEGRERTLRTYRILQRGWQQRYRVGLRRLVEGCWLALGGSACYDEGSLADAGQVLDLIESLESGGDLPVLEDLNEGLNRLYSAPDNMADSRLQIMTIHKAKGLEFDTVIIPGLGRLPGNTDHPLLRWVEHPDHGLLLAPIAPSGESKDPVYQLIGNLERAKDSHETTRLIYVATTRARRRLHLVGHGEFGSEGRVRAAKGSLLDKLWPSIGTFFQEQDSKHLESPADDCSRPGNRLCRLPLQWEPPATDCPIVPKRKPSPAPSHLDAKIGPTVHDFSGLAVRHAGTVTHVFLERIGREGVESWDRRRILRLREEIRLRLLREGIPKPQAKPWAEKILTSLIGVVTGDRGRWILAAREEAAVELAVSSSGMPLGIIDRTFVVNGVRWIVDYKTSLPAADEDEPRFLARELKRYRLQLQAYLNVFTSMEPDRRHRAALYFPMIDGWIELE